MKLAVFAEILARFPQTPAGAKTVEQIAEDWPFAPTMSARKRQLYHYIEELGSEGSPMGRFIRTVPRPGDAARGEPSRVYLDLTEVSNFFMSDGIALQLLLGRRAINPLLASVTTTGAETVEELALARLKAARSQATTLAGKIRVVPDGFPRLPAKIDPAVMRVMVEALVRKRKVEFDYCSFSGQQSRKKVGPLALVAKDGTIYLVSLEGVNSLPGAPWALHRMTNAKLGTDPFHHAPFDLDEWLERTGDLYHPLGEPDETITLELLVSPLSIRHFQERPLGPDQVISEPDAPGDWYRLVVTTKRWFTLTSFLLSFGPNLKVVSPAEVLEGKDGVLAWARGVAQLYPESD